MFMGWIGRYPSMFPFPMTILSIILTWGVALVIHEVDPSLAVAVAVILIILSVFLSIAVTRFIIYMVTQNIPGKIQIFGYIDGYFTLLHIFSSIMMSIVILSNPINYHFEGIPVGAKGYDLFVSYIFSNTITTFNGVGFNRDFGYKTPLGAILITIISITSAIYLIGVPFLIAIISTLRTKHKNHSNPKPNSNFNMNPRSSYNRNNRNINRGNPPNRTGRKMQTMMTMK